MTTVNLFNIDLDPEAVKNIIEVITSMPVADLLPEEYRHVKPDVKVMTVTDDWDDFRRTYSDPSSVAESPGRVLGETNAPCGQGHVWIRPNMPRQVAPLALVHELCHLVTASLIVPDPDNGPPDVVPGSSESHGKLFGSIYLKACRVTGQELPRPGSNPGMFASAYPQYVSSVQTLRFDSGPISRQDHKAARGNLKRCQVCGKQYDPDSEDDSRCLVAFRGRHIPTDRPGTIYVLCLGEPVNILQGDKGHAQPTTHYVGWTGQKAETRVRQHGVSPDTIAGLTPGTAEDELRYKREGNCPKCGTRLATECLANVTARKLKERASDS